MPEVPHELARLLRRANRAVEARMLAALAASGEDTLQLQHLTLLRVLDPAGGAARISELAREAGVSRQAIQQVAVQLERAGIVEILEDPDDRRARLVRYTPSGRAGYGRAMEAFARIERGYARRLGAARMRRLKEDLRTLGEE